MAEYYRTIFTIDREENRGLELLRDVERKLRECTIERFDEPADGYGEWQNESETLRLDGGVLGDTGFFGLSSTLANGWKLDFGLATKGGSVEADVQVQEIADVADSPSGNLHAGPPKMLSAVLEEFRCEYESEFLSSKPANKALEDANSFVQDEIFNPDRKLPIVVVTETYQGKPLADPYLLQTRLLGLAKVVTYDDDTTRKVNAQLGKLECYLGAIRIFMPECSLESSPWEHELWMPDKVKALGNDIWVDIRDVCMEHSRFQFGARIYPEVARQVRQRENERHRVEAENFRREAREYRKRLEQSQSDESTYAELLDASEQDVKNSQQLFEMSQEEISSLNKVIEERDFRILELEEQVKQLQSAEMQAVDDDNDDDADISKLKRRNQSLLRQVRISKNKFESVSLEKGQLEEEIARLRIANLGKSSSIAVSESSRKNDADVKLTSVRETVENAENSFGGLRFLPNAYDTAGSNFTRDFDDRAAAFFKTFDVLNQGAVQQATKGTLGASTTKWLESHGIEYSDESEDTKRRQECIKARTFHDPDGKGDVLMTYHVKMFGNAIRIHLKWEADENKWLIGYIGEHLPTSSDPH